MKHIDLETKTVRILRNQPGKTLWFINRLDTTRAKMILNVLTN